jgi:hypothetical protein
MTDAIRIKIEPGGRIKISTDSISLPNHGNAEDAIRMIARLAGGTVTITARDTVHEHVHTHEHDHLHE